MAVAFNTTSHPSSIMTPLPEQSSCSRRTRPSVGHRFQRRLVCTWKRVTRSLLRANPNRRASVLPGDFVMLNAANAAARRRSLMRT